MRIKNRLNKIGIKIIEKFKATPAYLKQKISNAWEAPNRKKARQLEIKYGPTLRNDQYYNNLIKDVTEKLDVGDEIGAISYIKDKAKRLRDQQSK